jgi:hypothetical protein
MSAGFNLSVISRTHSTATLPSGVLTIKTDYTLDKLTEALAGQAAVVCVVGPAGMMHQVTLIDAAEVAGVKRFIIDHLGEVPTFVGCRSSKTFTRIVGSAGITRRRGRRQTRRLRTRALPSGIQLNGSGITLIGT